jgi:two-component system, LytTR family, response regulator LytT
MKVLIFEDERLTAERLIYLLKKYDPQIEVLEVIDSVAKGVEWLSNNPGPELIFMDIRLSDTISFEIFEKINIDSPVIFTTAYDEYAIKAFKVNSVDYLVKPYDFKDLKTAIEKYKKYKAILPEKIVHDLLSRSVSVYKKRFLVKIGDQLKHIDISEIAYFKFEDGMVCAITRNKSLLPLDYSLDQLYSLLDPQDFFRINRKIIARIDAIGKIHSYFNGRLKIELIPPDNEDVIVSRERAGNFKEWLGG